MRLWDVSLGEPLLACVRGHSSPVSCVSVSPDDEVVASGGDEGKVVLYSRATTSGSAYSVGEEQDSLLRAFFAEPA